MLKLADTSLILINPSPSNVKGATDLFIFAWVKEKPTELLVLFRQVVFILPGIFFFP